jgi:nitrogenase molybdenum-cofactor synthesis protein NifE
VIAREEARIRAALEPWRERLKGKRVLLYTGGVKSWSVVSALQDLGMTVVATGTNKSTEEDKARIREIMGDDAKMIDRRQPEGAAAALPGLPGRHPDRRRAQPLHGAEGAHSLPRHQPGTRIRLRRLRRHAGTGAPVGADAGIAGVGQGAPASRWARRSPFSACAAAIPMLHGSQGCTAFGKVFFVRHFREPIPLQTTAMDQVSSIMSADENVIEGLRVLCEKNSPDIIGLPTTGLSETQGTDIRAWCANSALAIRSSRRRGGAGEHAGLPPAASKPVLRWRSKRSSTRWCRTRHEFVTGRAPQEAGQRARARRC